MAKKPKRIDNRKHKHKNFNYLLEYNKKKKQHKKGNKRNMIKTHTIHDANGKSTIRNMEEVFKPLVFADFNYLLEGKQSLTDVDGQLEINGNIFILESKTHYNSINGGQLVSLFHNAYNTWKRGKIGQLTYRISTGRFNEKGEELFDYIIYGTQQFKFNNITGKFDQITWVSAPYFGRDIWHDGSDTYYSGGSKLEYIKLPTSITWSNIPDNFDPINIWHIGDKTYYSAGTIHKIINEDTTSFDNFTEWKGLSNFDGKDIWQDIDGNIFYKDTYILDTKTKTWLPKYWNLIDNKKSSDIIKSEYIWSDSTSTYINNDYILNSYIDTCTQNCKFDNKQLSIESKLKREYTTYPINPVCLQAPSYALDMIKLPNNLLGWHSPDGIESPVIEVTIINNVTDKVQASFEIIREKYQNEWGRYIDKDDDFNPIINNAVSVIDTSSLLQGAQNMHYKVIIGGVDKDGNPGPKLDDPQKDIITKYLIPKFLGVSYEVEFK